LPYLFLFNKNFSLYIFLLGFPQIQQAPVLFWLSYGLSPNCILSSRLGHRKLLPPSSLSFYKVETRTPALCSVTTLRPRFNRPKSSPYGYIYTRAMTYLLGSHKQSEEREGAGREQWACAGALKARSGSGRHYRDPRIGTKVAQLAVRSGCNEKYMRIYPRSLLPIAN
jgi:hypothetical protein